MLTFVGDYLPDRPFSTLPCIRGDIVIANLEAAIGGDSRLGKTKAHPVVLGNEAFAHVSNSGVTAFNLANNHVYDAGARCFNRMYRILRKMSSLQVYGLNDAPFCVLSYGRLRVFLVGCLEPCRARGPRLFRQEDVTPLIRKLRSRADRIYVTPHWGKEGELACYPSPTQLRLAREWIHAGADGIFGHHPHSIHGHEQIGGRPVYYSLGNYQFDHAEGREFPVSEWGLAIRLQLSTRGDKPWPVFFHQGNGATTEADRSSVSTLSEHLDRISAAISDRTRRWTAWRWATNVGPIYVKKNQRSWRRRFQSNAVTALPLWLAWNCLPRTLLLRLGALWRRDEFHFPLASLSWHRHHLVGTAPLEVREEAMTE